MDVNRELEDWFEGWMQFMSNSEAPTIYNKWVAVSMLAAAIERKAFIKWDKSVFPNFYIVLVGPPGCRKGTAMWPAREILEDINIKIAADATTREALIRNLKNSSDNFEAIDGQIHNYSAMTIFSEELTVFLGYDNKQLMQDMSDWYDCKNHWKYETKHQGIDSIDRVYVNLCGATTPQLLQESLPMESFGGGLNSRIIYVFADSRERLVLFPFQLEGQDELKDQLSRDLQAIRLASGEFKPEDSFLHRWAGWYPHQGQIELAKDTRMAGYIDRRQTHLLKLSMIMNVSRAGKKQLTAQDFDRALALLEETERRMARTFAGVGKSSIAATTHRVLQYVKLHQKVPYSELLRTFYNDADDKTMSVVISTLEKAHLVSFDRSEHNGIREFNVTYMAGID